ncbi:hypothetical protein ACJ41O_006750 [Fusarium nematophilum]
MYTLNIDELRLGWENSLGLCPYNDRFRTHRKNMSRIIGSKTAAAQYNTLQEAEVGHFLLHMLDNPDDLMNQIRKEAGAVILKIAYGYTAEAFKDDVLVDMAGDAMDKFARAAVPGAFMVDMMPFLRYLSDWFPGTRFKRVARQWSTELNDVTDKPYAFVKHQMAHGRDDSSFLSRLLEAGDSTPEEKFTNKWSAMSLYTAGADTLSQLDRIFNSYFFLAMALFPEIQKKAQEEIDRVIGSDRLPTLSDRLDLPYIEATVNEVLRWHPVAPMGLPHTKVYDDPMSFEPERFLESKPAPDPHTFVFGFGRRICPGRILADNALYLNIVQSLAVFNISKGGEELKVAFTPGVVSHPDPFKAVIKPRSLRHEELIRGVEKMFPWEESDAQVLESMVY